MKHFKYHGSLLLILISFYLFLTNIFESFQLIQPLNMCSCSPRAAVLLVHYKLPSSCLLSDLEKSSVVEVSKTDSFATSLNIVLKALSAILTLKDILTMSYFMAFHNISWYFRKACSAVKNISVSIISNYNFPMYSASIICLIVCEGQKKAL